MLLTKYETYKIIYGLVSGIEAMHKKDLIHSDITLKNILITPDMSIVYIDPDVTKLYWKNQLDNAINIISSIASDENEYMVNKFGIDISNKILSEDIYKVNMIIQQILKISELGLSNFSTNISTILELKQQLKILFEETQDVR